MSRDFTADEYNFVAEANGEKRHTLQKLYIDIGCMLNWCDQQQDIDKDALRSMLNVMRDRIPTVCHVSIFDATDMSELLQEPTGQKGRRDGFYEAERNRP